MQSGLSCREDLRKDIPLLRLVLNVGCGTKTTDLPTVRNIDWSPYLRLSRSRSLRVLARPFLSSDRRRKLAELSSNVEVCDLSKGLPAESASVDVVYHSHFLEHLDRDKVPMFQREVHRVLKPGGVQRIVVPDLRGLIDSYLVSFEKHLTSGVDGLQHDQSIAALYEQSVRRLGYGTAHQTGVRKFVESLLFGDARRKGETHQWMYDEVNLSGIVESAGFVEVVRRDFRSSGVEYWHETGLDIDDNGNEYKPGSLYLECKKPS